MTSIACCGGTIDKTVPKGIVSCINGIQCYVSKPENIKSTDCAIFIATDVFGYKLPNVRNLADKFSEVSGLECVIPDLFNGTEPPANLMDSIAIISSRDSSSFSKFQSILRALWHFIPFLFWNSKSHNESRIVKVINEYRSKGYTKIALQGYCWGGSIALNIAQKPGIVDAISSNHPGGVKIPSDFEKLLVPTSLCLTPDKDMEIKHEQVRIIEQLLKKKNGGMEWNSGEKGAFPYICKSYANVSHGFSVRGDENLPEINKLRNEAFTTAWNFFKEILNL
jgi:dienelactone hydrolase